MTAAAGCPSSAWRPALLVGLVTLAACDGEPAAGTRERLALSGAGWWLQLEAPATADVPPPRLAPPGLDLASLGERAPPGGFEAALDRGRPVRVPGTVEGVFGEALGDVRGRSWWSREFSLPAAAAGRRARLLFDGARQIAEVYVDGRLLGTDAVGLSPFVVELGDAGRPGTVQRLDVAITDPGGHLDWRDHTAMRWGPHTLPNSPGFGGLTGDVTLELVDEQHVADVFVRNTAEPRRIEVEVTVEGGTRPRDPLQLEIRAWPAGERLLTRELPAPPAGWPGTVAVTLDLPSARLWSPEDPALHELVASFAGGDALAARFGLRWLDVDLPGDDDGGGARFRLNGRPVVLRSAISWGYWPVTGLVPTRELAAQQVHAAKALGLNLLNHHRAPAHPYALDASDELGLLAHLEPGGYLATGGDEACRALASLRWLRLVAAHRNRPSVVIHNLINEADLPPWPGALADLHAARALDPSRVLTYTSAWAERDDRSLSLHALPRPAGRDAPGSEAQSFRTAGWHDQHEAPGPGSFRDAFYRGPGALRLGDAPRDAIAWRGEEGAIAGPPRLASLVELYGDARMDGWDGAAFRRQAAGWQADLQRLGLFERLGGLDAMTASAAAVAVDHHARTLSLLRAVDLVDAYVINGFESQPFENHSGLVDIWRRPKADPTPLATASAPEVLVVAPRGLVHAGARQVGGGLGLPTTVTVDLWLVSELRRSGVHDLSLAARGPDGAVLWSRRTTVEIPGDGRLGRLLHEGERVDLELAEGRVTLEATLAPSAGGGTELTGSNAFQLVDWRSATLGGAVAKVGELPVIDRFLREAKGLALPAFDAASGRLDAIVVAGCDPEPASADVAALVAGPIAVGWFQGGRLAASSTARAPAILDAGEALPAALVPEPWTWIGTAPCVPTESGEHRFVLQTACGARLRLDGELILDEPVDRGPRRLVSGAVSLVAGTTHLLEIELLQSIDKASATLAICGPSDLQPGADLAREVLRRVEEEGTTLLVLHDAPAWARRLDALGAVDLEGELFLGRYWMGGGYLAAPHTLLAGLPADGALGWPWQALVSSERRGHGLILTGAETVVACWSDHQPRIASALAVVPHGRGRIVLSSLDLAGALGTAGGAVDLPRRLLVNLVADAVRR